MPPSCSLLGGFAIGAWVALLWQHNTNPGYNHNISTTILRPFFGDHPGEPVPEEDFWTSANVKC